MARMSVLEVTTSFPRFIGDFAGSFNMRQDAELVKNGVDILVLAPGAFGYPKRESINGVDVIRVSYFFPASLQGITYGCGIKPNLIKNPLLIFQAPFLAAALFLHILRHGRKKDVIHCHWVPTAIIALLAKPFIKKPIILTLGGTDYRDIPTPIWTFVIKHVDAVIAVALDTQKHLERVGFSDYELIPTMINEQEFNRSIDASDVVEEFRDMIRGRKIISFVSRLYELKDPTTLIEAIPLVLEKRIDVLFFIIGGGILLPALKMRVEELGITDNVVFTDFRKDVQKFLRISDLFVATSQGGHIWSNVLAEAMFMEVPLLLTNSGIASEFFTHEKDAYFVGVKDPQSVADGIIYLLDHPELMEKMVLGAKELLVKHGKNRGQIVDKLIGLYERVRSASDNL